MPNQATKLMAVDVGTSFIKTFVYDLTGACVASAVSPVKDERPASGIFIQRGNEIFESVVSSMRQVCEVLGDKASSVEAIIFTGQMAGFMGVDKEWNDITTWSCSLDTRYIPYADRQISEYKQTFRRLSGTGAPQMAPKYEWFKNDFPDLSKKISKYLMISGYVLGRLGELPIEDAVMDVTFSTWTGLADIAKREWSDEICQFVGLNRGLLPRIVDSNSICSYLSKRMADIIGLKAGIPLVSGAGDKVAGCIGSAVLEPGDANLEASSYGAIHVCADDFRPDESYDCLPSPIPGRFYLTKYIAGSGITLDWFLDNFIPKDNESVESAFERLDRDILSVPTGCNGLMAIGLLAGNAFPLDGAYRGMWMGFDWSHKPEHFYKALLESYSYEFAITFDRIKSNYPNLNIQSVNTLGGGAKSSGWMQICADVTGMKHLALNRSDAAPWGAAILAGNAIGVFPDMKETAKNTVKTTHEYITQEPLNLIYQKNKTLYMEFLVELKNFYERLANIGS